MDLATALRTLDFTNDDHWTSDGLPRMDVIAELTEDSTLTRKAVTEFAPDFSRAAAAEAADEAPLEGEPEAAPEETEPEPEVESEEDEEGEDGEDEEEESDEEDGDDEEDDEGEEEEEYEDDVVDVLAMPIGDVLASPELTALATEAVDEEIAEALAAKKEAEATLQQLNAKCELLKRQTIQHERNRPAGEKTTGVQAFLRAQAESRARRAENAQRFIDAGTTPREVADAIRGGSQLDNVMGQRGKGRGARRPAPRTPAGR